MSWGVGVRVWGVGSEGNQLGRDEIGVAQPYIPNLSLSISLSLSQYPFLLRALPTETKVESGTAQIKSGTSVNLSNSGELQAGCRHC